MGIRDFDGGSRCEASNPMNAPQTYAAPLASVRVAGVLPLAAAEEKAAGTPSGGQLNGSHLRPRRDRRESQNQ